MIDIPIAVRNKASACGAEAWLRELPKLIAHFEGLWNLTLGRTFPDGTEAFVAAATRNDGTPAVLKLCIPRPGGHARNEMTVLRLAAGNGCARLFEYDETLAVLLIERLGSSLHDIGLPITRRHEILCDAAAQLWRPAPESGLPTGAEKGHALIEFIESMWTQLDRPCTERAVAYALDCARRRIAAHDDEQAVLVHGDVHQWNALQSGDGYKLVDPDGLLAEPEYDLGIIMREDPLELMHGDPHERSRWLAARSGLDETAIWEWGVVERVSTGLLCLSIDLQPVGNEILRAADCVAR